jgi:hypothetical protein
MERTPDFHYVAVLPILWGDQTALTEARTFFEQRVAD